MRKEKFIIGAAVAAVLFIAVAYAYIQVSKLQNSNVAPDAANAKTVLCDVSIHNPIGVPLVVNGDLYIESVNCQQQYVKNCGSFYGVFSDTGSLSISGTGGIGSSSDIAVGEISSKSSSLNWCGSTLTSSVKITLRDDSGNILQAKDVQLG